MNVIGKEQFNNALGACNDVIDGITFLNIPPVWFNIEPSLSMGLNLLLQCDDIQAVIRKEFSFNNQRIEKSMKFQILVQFVLMYVSFHKEYDSFENALCEMRQEGHIFKLAEESSFITYYVSLTHSPGENVSVKIAKCDAMIWFLDHVSDHYDLHHKKRTAAIQELKYILSDSKAYYNQVVINEEKEFLILTEFEDGQDILENAFSNDIIDTVAKLTNLMQSSPLFWYSALPLPNENRLKAKRWLKSWNMQILKLLVLTSGQKPCVYQNLQRPPQENWKSLKNHFTETSFIYFASAPSADRIPSCGLKVAFPKLVYPFISYHMDEVLVYIDNEINFTTESCGFMLRDPHNFGRVQTSTVTNLWENVFMSYVQENLVHLFTDIEALFCCLLLKCFYKETFFESESFDIVLKYIEMCTTIPQHIAEVYYEKRYLGKPVMAIARPM